MAASRVFESSCYFNVLLSVSLANVTVFGTSWIVIRGLLFHVMHFRILLPFLSSTEGFELVGVTGQRLYFDL